MVSQQRRLVYYLVSLTTIFAVFTALYDYGMSAWQGQNVTTLHAVRIVATAFTTTGFGADSALWTTWQMNVLTIAMQFTGIVTIFAALPLFVIPLIEEALRTHPPTSVEDAAGHVIVCESTPHGDALIEELEARDVPYTIVVEDADEATDLYESGRPVIRGAAEQAETLRAARATHARAIVADGSDELNASIALTADEVAPDVQVVTLVEDPRNEQYHRYAGADDVIAPEDVLGISLADKVTTRVLSDLGDAVEIGDDLEIAEFSIQPGSEICDTPLSEAGIRRQTGVNIIGIWVGGEFQSPPAPDTFLERGTVLLVVGTDEQIGELKAMTRSRTRRHTRGTVVVAGHGKVGSQGTDTLSTANVSTTVVDVEDKPGVDIVGDATDEWTLREAGMDEARTVVLALSDDTDAVFATLIVRELHPEIEIVVRANETERVRKLYQAGADYVIALSTVSGRMLASTILDEEVISLNTQVEIVRTLAPRFTGATLAESNIRARTGCTVIAVQRDGETLTDVGPDFYLQSGDEVIVAGTDQDVNAFTAVANPGGQRT